MSEYLHKRILNKSLALTVICFPMLIGLALSSMIAAVTTPYLQWPFLIGLIACVTFIFHYERKSRNVGLERRYRYALICKAIGDYLEKGDLNSALRQLRKFSIMLNDRWGTREKLKKMDFDGMEIFFNPSVKSL